MNVLRREEIPPTEALEEGKAALSTSDPLALSDRTTIEQEESTPPAVPTISIGRYHCMSEKHWGSLCVSTDGVDFRTTPSENEDGVCVTVRCRVCRRDVSLLFAAVFPDTTFDFECA